MSVHIGSTRLTKANLNFRLSWKYFHDIIGLSDKFTSVCKNDDLSFADIDVHTHETWHGKGSCFTTSIDCLEHEVSVSAAKHVWDRNSLDDRWLSVAHLLKALSDILWHI